MCMSFDVLVGRSKVMEKTDFSQELNPDPPPTGFSHQMAQMLSPQV